MSQLWVLEVSFWGWGYLGASGCLKRLLLCMLLFVLFSRTRKSCFVQSILILQPPVCKDEWLVCLMRLKFPVVESYLDVGGQWTIFGGCLRASEYLDTPSPCLLWYCILVFHSLPCFWFSLCVRHSVCVRASIWACMSVFLCVSMNACAFLLECGRGFSFLFQLHSLHTCW